MSEPGPVLNFVGHRGRECGAHHTAGPHRAWCFDCSEWCYPLVPCARCELPILRLEMAAAALVVNAALTYTAGADGDGELREAVTAYQAWVRDRP
jgi:hypothetical protein